MDIFAQYVNKRIYKSLAIIDNFQQEFWQLDLLSLLDDAFTHCDTYQDSLPKLSEYLNHKGLKTYRSRYAKYKSAHKRRSDKKIVEVSQDILEQITKAMALTSAVTYDELFERLLDKSDHHINSILASNASINDYQTLQQTLPVQIQTLINNKLISVYSQGYADGMSAVPTDLRKKTKSELLDIQFQQKIEQFKAKINE